MKLRSDVKMKSSVTGTNMFAVNHFLLLIMYINKEVD